MAEEEGRSPQRQPRQQLPLNVPVQVAVQSEARRHSVQVILASEWSQHLGAAPPGRTSFRVVLLTSPLEVAPADLQSDRVFVCVPSKALPATAIAETRAEYRAGSPSTPWTWSPGQAEAFSGGTLLQVRRSNLDAGPLIAGGDTGTFLQRLAALAEAEDLRSQVASMEAYLNAALPRKTDEEIFLDRLSLQEQLSMGAVSQDPALWPSVKALFALFKSNYARAYLRHHRAYRNEVAGLQQELRKAEDKVKALRLLDGIEELGDPVGGAALVAYERCLRSIQPCNRAEADLTTLDTDPVCPACRVALNAPPLGGELQAALTALQSALDEQQRRLSAEAVRQVLSQQQEPRIGQFVKVLQLADVSGLVKVLDEEKAQFLRSLLSEVTVEVPWSALLQELHERFPMVAEGEVGAFLEAQEELLRRALEEARAAHPGKHIRLKFA